MSKSNLNRLRLAPEQLAFFCGGHVLVANRYGLLQSGRDGFYDEQTRFLSRSVLTSGGRPVRPVSAGSVTSRSTPAYLLLQAGPCLQGARSVSPPGP